MAKKVLKIVGIVLGSICVALGAAYLLIALMFNSRLMPNTSVNQIAAGNKSAEVVNQELAGQMEPYKLSLNLQDGSQVEVDGTSFGHRYDYSNDINGIIASQKPLEWGWYFVNPTRYQATPVSTYDEDQLKDTVQSLDCFHIDETNEQATVKVENHMNKYYLKDERSDALDSSAATTMIIDSVNNMEAACDLSSAYVEPKATSEQEAILNQWSQIDQIQNASIQFVDGDLELLLDKYTFTPWIKVDSNQMPVLGSDGSVTLDEEKVRAFVSRLADTYNTDQKPRKWQKYKGGVVEIPCSKPGYIVDEDAEVEAIVKAISHGQSETRKPIFSQEGTGRGNAEVGDTYVEVDMGNQKVYFFENGKLKMESDIVTGNKRYHYDTPAMMTDIYFMQEGRTLRGENYATFVYYWMAFYNHYGLHDATWRNKFGGDIYLTDGSHGCVNLPKEFAGKLYESVQVGTPVVLYY